MAFEKIADTALVNKGVTGLPDVPGLTTAEMQAKFDELSRDVIIPKLNEIVDGLNGDEVGLSSQIENPETKEKDVIQNVVNAIYQIVKENSDKSHNHGNKETLDKVTSELYESITELVGLFNGISAVDKSVTDDDTKIPTSSAIVNYVTELGGGDMQKAVYDKNNTGIVDDAEKLGGVAAENYLQVSSLPDTAVAFEEAETRSNISTGEKVSTVFGKIKKFFSDLTAPAFAQMITSADDLLATKVTGYVPDAKAVADTYTELNRKLCQYNSETDCLDIYSDGEIIGSIPCNFQIFKFANTKGSDWVCSSNMSVFTDGNNIIFKPANLSAGGGWSARYTQKITFKNGAQIYYSVGNNRLFWSGNLQYSANGTDWVIIKAFASGAGGTGSVALPSGDYYFMFSGYSNTNPTDAVFPTLEIK